MLNAGTKLGPYEVLAPLGAGGMGEVYRARDTKLGREVALKVLPAAMAGDAERMARFEREAQVLASLNHPNIAVIHGFEESGGTRALVMELVEGPTLADRIGRGPMPLDETLPIARQVAEALEYAHERGIIHRDLKPANIKLNQEQQVKVLDFGLAKALEGEGPPAPISNSPTLSAMATQAGVILGTAAYMSPEQAKGKAVDRRADIWAFGCVVYEMLTGKQAFAGETATEVLAAVIMKDPEWNALPATTPAAIQRLLRRCLTKEPKRRLQAIGDARIAIEETLSGTPDISVAGTPPLQSWRRALPWALAGAFLAAACVVTTAYLRLAHSPAHAVISQVPAPAKSSFASSDVGAVPELSPDGTHLAFVAVGSEGKGRLWVRSLDSTVAQPLEGTEDAIAPFWSADSRYLAFYAGGKLKKVDLTGGAPVDICDASLLGRSGSWNAEGTILFAPAVTSGLYRVPAGGGTPVPVTTLDKSRQETSHRWPQFLPDRRHFIYFVVSSSTSYEGTYVGSLDGGEPKLLLRGDSNALYAPPGYLLFVRGGNLMAQRFDSSRLELVSDPVAIANGAGILIGWRAAFAASENGMLAYWAGGAARNAEMRWFDRAGKAGGVIGGGVLFFAPRLSPDGEELVVEEGKTVFNSDIWVLNLARGVPTRLTFSSGSSANLSPIWSPDGKKIAFASTRKGGFHLYVKPANGTGATEPLLEDNAAEVPDSWSSDGQYLAFDRRDPQRGAGSNIWILPLSGDRKPFPFIENQFDNTDASFSPDGKLLAYSSDESGAYQVYVVPFPKGNGKWLVSTNGGVQPHWRRDGKELFYVSADFKLTAVEVHEKGDSVGLGNPAVLFPIKPPQYAAGYFDVTSDGKKFVVLTQSEQTSAEPITLIVNWPALLKKP